MNHPAHILFERLKSFNEVRETDLAAAAAKWKADQAGSLTKWQIKKIDRQIEETETVEALEKIFRDIVETEKAELSLDYIKLTLFELDFLFMNRSIIKHFSKIVAWMRRHEKNPRPEHEPIYQFLGDITEIVGSFLKSFNAMNPEIKEKSYLETHK